MSIYLSRSCFFIGHGQTKSKKIPDNQINISLKTGGLAIIGRKNRRKKLSTLRKEYQN